MTHFSLVNRKAELKINEKHACGEQLMASEQYFSFYLKSRIQLSGKQVSGIWTCHDLPAFPCARCPVKTTQINSQ